MTETILEPPKVSIPPQLAKLPGNRFLRVQAGGKRPIDVDWNNPTNLFTATSPEIIEWLARGNNYGVAAGYGLAIVDADNSELCKLIEFNLPPTFCVRSGSGRGHHYYFLCDSPDSYVLFNATHQNLGNIQGPGRQVVGPTSIHESGGRYDVINDVELAQINFQQLQGELGDYMKSKTQIRDEANKNTVDVTKQFGEFDITKLIKPEWNLKTQGDELYGCHPIHGSSTGRNFWISPEKNTYYCFRCGVGGSAYHLLALSEGILQCHECGPDSLKGDKFKRVREIAIERGLIKPVDLDNASLKSTTDKALEEYVQKLKHQILCEEVEPIPYNSLDEFYDLLVNDYQTTLSLDKNTPYLFASYSLLTQQTPNLDFIFQLFISGVKGSGKSTAGKRLRSLCYCGFKSGAATFPGLVRLNSAMGGMTQIIDEADLSLDSPEVIRYLRGATDRENKYLHAGEVQVGNKRMILPVCEDTFGPRIIITSYPIKDEMVRDRCIEVVMKSYPNYITPPGAEEIAQLRGYLAYYCQQVKLTVTEEDRKKYYDPVKHSGRLNEIKTLLYLVTPKKHHDKIQQIIDEEFAIRTGLERDSYTAKIIDALTQAVFSEDPDDQIESATHGLCVPVKIVKSHYDLANADKATGRGKTSTRAIGRVFSNIHLKTEVVREKGTNRIETAWPIDKEKLAQARQSVYLEPIDGLLALGSLGKLGYHSALITENKDSRETPIPAPCQPYKPNKPNVSLSGASINTEPNQPTAKNPPASPESPALVEPSAWPQNCTCGYEAIDPRSKMDHRCASGEPFHEPDSKPKERLDT